MKEESKVEPASVKFPVDINAQGTLILGFIGMPYIEKPPPGANPGSCEVAGYHGWVPR
jgi:hypothetical protein